MSNFNKNKNRQQGFYKTLIYKKSEQDYFAKMVK